jgi:hypothetical protein
VRLERALAGRYLKLRVDDMKLRPCPSCGVANPRDTARYRCGLRRACRTNPSMLLINLVMKRSAGVLRHQ